MATDQCQPTDERPVSRKYHGRNTESVNNENKLGESLCSQQRDGEYRKKGNPQWVRNVNTELKTWVKHKV